MDQTAHISLQLPAISKSDRDKIDSVRPNLFGAPRLNNLCCCLRLVALVVTAGPSGAPLVHLCAAGEGLSTYPRRNLQVLFLRKMTFFSAPTKYGVLDRLDRETSCG